MNKSDPQLNIAFEFITYLQYNISVILYKGLIEPMNFLVKVVDFKNNIFYATPVDQQGLRVLGSKDKAEIFKLKKNALETIVKMKQIQEMKNYVYHIEQME
jgi:hypothetical protein